jgi:cytochrome c oxidase subunit I
VYKTARTPMVEIDDPWGWGRSLEWATSSPPPRHNFHSIPRIRTDSPAFDLHHPEARQHAGGPAGLPLTVAHVDPEPDPPRTPPRG